MSNNLLYRAMACTFGLIFTTMACTQDASTKATWATKGVVTGEVDEFSLDLGASLEFTKNDLSAYLDLYTTDSELEEDNGTGLSLGFQFKVAPAFKIGLGHGNTSYEGLILNDGLEAVLASHNRLSKSVATVVSRNQLTHFTAQKQWDSTTVSGSIFSAGAGDESGFNTAGFAVRVNGQTPNKKLHFGVAAQSFSSYEELDAQNKLSASFTFNATNRLSLYGSVEHIANPRLRVKASSLNVMNVINSNFADIGSLGAAILEDLGDAEQYIDLNIADDGATIADARDTNATDSQKAALQEITDAETVILGSQGGPTAFISRDYFSNIGTLPDKVAYVSVHQYQTLNPEVLLGDNAKVRVQNPEDYVSNVPGYDSSDGITADEYNDIRYQLADVGASALSQAQANYYAYRAAAIMANTIRHFKKQGKNVVVTSHSFGSVLMPLVLTEFSQEAGSDFRADKLYISAGRLEFPHQFVDYFEQGCGAGYVDGVTLQEPSMCPDTTLSTGMVNGAKLQAGLGRHRYIEAFNSKNVTGKALDLSHLTYVYGSADQAVGSLTTDEHSALEDLGAEVDRREGAGHGVSPDYNF